MRLILALLLATLAFAQSGTVTDLENGDVFPGVNLSNRALYDPSTLILDDRGKIRFLGQGWITNSLPARGLEALYAPPSLALNPTARWYTPATNLLKYSEDMTGTGWVKVRTSANSATRLIEDSTASNTHYIRQDLSGIPYGSYVYSASVKAGERTWMRMYVYFDSADHWCSINLATGAGGTCNAAFTRTIADQGGGWYRVSLTFSTSSSTTVQPGAYLATADTTTIYNGDGTSGAYLTDAQLNPGSTAAIYEATTDRQVITDFSGKGNDATLGSDATAATDDPALAVTSRNLLAAGSTENLQSGWTITGSGSTIDSATQCTFGANTSNALYQSVTTQASVYYRVSATVTAVSGGTVFNFAHISSATGNLGGEFTATSTPTRYSTVALGKTGGGAVLFGLYNGQAATATITATDWQVERVPSASSSATSYVSPAAPTVQGWSFDGVDDLIQVAGFAPSSPVTACVPFKQTAVDVDVEHLIGLWGAGGAGNASWSIRVANGVVGSTQYEVDTTTVKEHSYTPKAGEWAIACTSISGTTGMICINGNCEAYTGGSTPQVSTNYSLRIGRSNANTLAFDGTLTTPSIYSRALSASEVARATRELARRLSEQGICVELSDGWQGACKP